jgi:hypothetical protein
MGFALHTGRICAWGEAKDMRETMRGIRCPTGSEIGEMGYSIRLQRA